MQSLMEPSAAVDENVSTSVTGHAVQNVRRISTVQQGNIASGGMCLVFKINVEMFVTSCVFLIPTVGIMDLAVMTVGGLGQEEDARIKMIICNNCFNLIGSNLATKIWICCFCDVPNRIY